MATRLALIIGLSGVCAGPACAAPAIDPSLRDPALEGSIAQALRSGPLLAARVSEVSASRHEVQAARWQYAPSLSTQLQAGSGPASAYGSVLRADQRLYAGGRLDADLGNAVARRDSALLSVQETSLAVALQVVTDWKSLQTAQGQEDAARRYRARLDTLNATIGRRIASGVSPAIEQSLINARLVQSGNDLATAEAARQAARASLQRLVGETRLDAVAAPAYVAAPPPAILCDASADGELALRAALDNHPAIRRNGLDLDAARFAVDSQRAATRPSVTLRVEQPIGPSAGGAPRDPRLSVVFEYSTDARLTAAARADAGAERLNGLADQALALRRDLRQQITTECSEYASVAQRVAGHADAQAYNDEVLASYTRLFVAGKRGWLDLLNAAREGYETEQNALAANAALRASHYRLALLGGGYALPTPDTRDPDDDTPAHPLLDRMMKLRTALGDTPAGGTAGMALAPASAPAPAPASTLASAPTTPRTSPTPPRGAGEQAGGLLPQDIAAMDSAPRDFPVPPSPADRGETMAPASPATAAPGTPPSDIAAAIARWADAWRRKDVAAYLAMYTDDFTGQTQPPSHDAWVAQRTARIGGKRRIELQLGELQVTAPSATEPRAVVRFTQAYAGDGHRETSRKQLHLRRIGGAWLIDDERELP